jgi:hypothetical protein
MPFDVTWEPHGVCKRYWGFVDGAELLQSVAEVQSDPRFDGIRFIINDYLDVVSADVSEKTITLVKAAKLGARVFHPRICIALVTTDEAIKDLLDPLVSGPLKPYPTEIFGALSDAREWAKESIS